MNDKKFGDLDQRIGWQVGLVIGNKNNMFYFSHGSSVQLCVVSAVEVDMLVVILAATCTLTLLLYINDGVSDFSHNQMFM